VARCVVDCPLLVVSVFAMRDALIEQERGTVCVYLGVLDDIESLEGAVIVRFAKVGSVAFAAVARRAVDVVSLALAMIRVSLQGIRVAVRPGGVVAHPAGPLHWRSASAGIYASI
jgi:hypothetical protein